MFPKEVFAFTTKRSLARNFQRISSIVGIDESHIFMPHQVHSDHIFQVTSAFLSFPKEKQKALLEGYDAIFTDLRGVCIGVSTADCVPILLYDNGAKAIAAVHSGWRGTVNRILEKTISCMAKTLNSSPENIVAVVAPHISQEHYEVGDEVFDAFLSAGFPMNDIAKKQGKWHIDLGKCNVIELLECGVKEENIYQEPLCSYSEPDILFSARREQVGQEKCGRNFNAIFLHE